MIPLHVQKDARSEAIVLAPDIVESLKGLALPSRRPFD
jgi:hypothetical protein